ncbi:MAG: LuxR C-terminal-related transcriptional regulator [Firmicutes bacterium]|nr:LuxR C-terminal-related transcriptional regulator [Bacillota bacterium]
MDRKLLLEIIDKGLIFHLITVAGLFFVHRFLMFKLILRILKTESHTPKIYYAIVFMTLFNFAKPFLPPLLFMILMTGLIVSWVRILYKTGIVKTLWSTILAILAAGIVEIVVLSPLLLNKAIGHFLFHTFYGFCLAAISEILPLVIALLILNKFPNISLIPTFKSTRPRLRKIELYSITGLVVSFFLVFSISSRLWEGLRKGSEHVPAQLILEWLASLVMAFIIYTPFDIIKTERKEQVLKKQLDETRIKLLEEQNHTLNSINGHLTEQITANNAELKDLKKSISNLQDYNTWLIIQTRLKMRAETDSIPVADNLTRRDLDILHLIALGKSNGEIGQALYLSENTVKKYIADIMVKLKLHTRVQLGVYAFARGLVTEEELRSKSETPIEGVGIDPIGP